ncbi:hypothetical protein HKX54_13800 [Sulfitobacter sp. M57]|uniref:hypothetical protein n=1 Tax=unclassified Sulfitobacter TaxID=196795 RepID=UPI0023E1D95B|nr:MULTISPECIES: hypothetical protein [unclassified Sulfitobacter]MDF3415539.1 hypothetical protein [Sulfitobacter sp. KE5]MDF3423020.1 hypothetical protein [Sulfitobacter sp. KE43]MDF3434085.1 hypothetical protein [Sulfitobacter sp. KE42]MDF3459882.1 hypothetical protein [Sulfitobacter sp. S74]MDF3463624.1 hypothetical protein [Sulfitobacter sp. Ks18]
MGLDISTGEIGTTRVFSLSMPPTQARSLQANPQAQLAILGAEGLNPDGLEVFQLADLGDVGLVGYLRDGTDAPEADLKRDAAKLAALDGWVMLVHSLAFGGKATTLTPASALTLIGTYAQSPASRPQTNVSAHAAQPYTGPPPPSATATDTRRGGSLAVGALILLAVVILWWALA